MLCNVMFIFIVIRSCFDSRGCSSIILELNLSAMHRFLASSTSNSPGIAEQSATCRRSGEQPATSLDFKLSSIRDVQAWLKGEQVAACSSADAQRIREAVAE